MCRTWSETPKTGFLASRLNSSVFTDRSILSTSSKYSVLEQSLSPLTSTPTKPKSNSKPVSTLKIMNINFQSIVNKNPDFHCIIETEKPDVVVGTESWLSPEISSSEIFPLGYTPYRRKTGRGGGVFVLVRNDYICSEQPQFQTDCELIWVKLEVKGTHPLFIGAFYRPNEEDLTSILELTRSLEDVQKHAKGNICLLGDFNFPNLTWPDNQPLLKPDFSLNTVYEKFLDLIEDFNFVQMVTEPTRQNNILDLFLCTNPTLVNHIGCHAGLGDHDLVTAQSSLKPSVHKQKPRRVQLF